MTSEQYVYWCQGFVELTGGVHPTPEQWKMIKEHLELVLTKVTPPPSARLREVSHGGSGGVFHNRGDGVNLPSGGAGGAGAWGVPVADTKIYC